MSDLLSRPSHTASPRTARELLVEVAGSDHQDHTLVRRGKADSGAIALWCSCGALLTVPDTAVNRLCTRNVSEVAS